MGAGLSIVVSAILWTAYARETAWLKHEQDEAMVRIGGDLLRVAKHYLDTDVTLQFDGRHFATTWSNLGMQPSEHEIADTAQRLYQSGAPPIPEDIATRLVALDRTKALGVLAAYKDSYDRSPLNAKLDLVARRIIPEAAGFGIHAYESLIVIEEAARHNKRSIEFAGEQIPPTVTRHDIGDLDALHILGWFETKYPPGERDRNYNLKLAAEKLNGYILMPSQEFSFNTVVGDRTEKEGYRVAHVIQEGEMVDGLAGGACQISSTLHAAAWFAGIAIMRSAPHSRPSAYIPMGLDATVVYPTTDLKLRNPYDFPVVFRYIVSQGTVRVEILGKPRPYDQIVFEREVKKELPYETVVREDPSAREGLEIVEQIGVPGYELERHRLFYRSGKMVDHEHWALRYPPTKEYIRRGTNPNPKAPLLKPLSLHRPMPPGKDPVFRLEQ